MVQQDPVARADIQDLREEIRSLRSEMNSRFSTVENRFNTMENRFNNLENRISQQFWVSLATLGGLVIGVGGIIVTVLLTK